MATPYSNGRVCNLVHQLCKGCFAAGGLYHRKYLGQGACTVQLPCIHRAVTAHLPHTYHAHFISDMNQNKLAHVCDMVCRRHMGAGALILQQTVVLSGSSQRNMT